MARFTKHALAIADQAAREVMAFEAAQEPFIAAIRALPNDPLPRLVYADWLDENGRSVDGALQRVLAEPDEDRHRLAYADAVEGTDPERAEFVRVQVELARLIASVECKEPDHRPNYPYPGCADWRDHFRHFDTLHRRERELLERGTKWLPPPNLLRSIRVAGRLWRHGPRL